MRKGKRSQPWMNKKLLGWRWGSFLVLYKVTRIIVSDRSFVAVLVVWMTAGGLTRFPWSEQGFVEAGSENPAKSSASQIPLFTTCALFQLACESEGHLAHFLELTSSLSTCEVNLPTFELSHRVGHPFMCQWIGEMCPAKNARHNRIVNGIFSQRWRRANCVWK